MSRYVLTPQAQQDLQHIRDYLLAEAGARIARYVLSSIVSACRTLAGTPGLGHRRQDLTPREETRFWPVFSYLIVYRIDKKPLTVIAIVHAKRNLESLLPAR